MPKNKGKEGKNRNRGKNEADDEKRELVFKEDGQEYYVKVLCLLRNDRCKAMCIDGTKRLCHVRGMMHKKVCTADDIILVGLRDYEDDKSGVIIKYMLAEARLLKACGELRVEMHK